MFFKEIFFCFDVNLGFQAACIVLSLIRGNQISYQFVVNKMVL